MRSASSGSLSARGWSVRCSSLVSQSDLGIDVLREKAQRLLGKRAASVALEFSHALGNRLMNQPKKVHWIRSNGFLLGLAGAGGAGLLLSGTRFG